MRESEIGDKIDNFNIHYSQFTNLQLFIVCVVPSTIMVVNLFKVSKT